VRVVVDWDLCESNGLCMVSAPEVFELQDDDTLLILEETPDESLRDKVADAVRGCPKGAISLQD
jgi:ferredoxin